MIKVKILYSNNEEKKKLISTLNRTFKIKSMSKEYKKEGLYKRIHIDLLEK